MSGCTIVRQCQGMKLDGPSFSHFLKPVFEGHGGADFQTGTRRNDGLVLMSKSLVFLHKQ